MSNAEAEWRLEGYPNCPCGIPDCIGLKLSVKTGHVVRTCLCPSCRGKRNQKAGKRTEAKRHRALGGVGFTPGDELGHCYSINVSTQDKRGQQIPANFRTFALLEWTRKAFSQVERSIPVGSGAFAALYLDVPGRGEFLVVDVTGRSLREAE